MTDLPVFVIVNLSRITDAAAYRVYEKGFFPILKKHGGEFITFDDQSITLEGDNTLQGRIIIFKFKNEEAAKDWYRDPEYQSISEHRRNGTELNFLTLVHGIPART